MLLFRCFTSLQNWPKKKKIVVLVQVVQPSGNSTGGAAD